MRIQHIIENANSAAQLKAAFEPQVWRNILYHFLSQRGGMGSTRLGVENNLEQALKKLGPGMADTTTADDWNAKASRFGAQIAATAPTWPAIYNHLAAVANAPAAPPTPPGLRTDVDATDESERTVAGWVQAEANLNYEQAREYFHRWTLALTRHRNQEYINQVSSNTRFRARFVAIQNEFLPDGENTVSKAAIDRALYAWLTSVDQSLNRPGAL